MGTAADTGARSWSGTVAYAASAPACAPAADAADAVIAALLVVAAAVGSGRESGADAVVVAPRSAAKEEPSAVAPAVACGIGLGLLCGACPCNWP